MCCPGPHGVVRFIPTVDLGLLGVIDEISRAGFLVYASVRCLTGVELLAPGFRWGGAMVASNCGAPGCDKECAGVLSLLCGSTRPSGRGGPGTMNLSCVCNRKWLDSFFESVT